MSATAARPAGPSPPGLELVDVRHLGRERVVCCARVDDVIVDPGPESSSATLLRALGDWAPRAILLTHIHFDHAGATGALLRRWPGAEVWVHERGARHLIDPSKLVASAQRIYGDDMERLWGEVVPVPEANVRILQGGERLGPWHVRYTPGHAQHHVAYLHEPTRTAFCGDVAGVRIGDGPVLPPTPPPDIDLEQWRASVELVRDWAPDRLVITHFGAIDDPQEHLDALLDGLSRQAARARELDSDAFAELVRAEIERAADPATVACYLQAMPPETLWAGLDRYLRRQEATGTRAGGPA